MCIVTSGTDVNKLHSPLTEQLNLSFPVLFGGSSGQTVHNTSSNLYFTCTTTKWYIDNGDQKLKDDRPPLLGNVVSW